MPPLSGSAAVLAFALIYFVAFLGICHDAPTIPVAPGAHNAKAE